MKLKRIAAGLLGAGALYYGLMAASYYGDYLASRAYPDLKWFAPREAGAQVPTPVIEAYDIKLGWIDWSWVEGPTAASQLRMKCGPKPGQYTFTRIVAGTAPVPLNGRIMMADLLPKAGLAYCVLVGALAIPGTNPVLYVEGGASSEIPFAAGDAPTGQGKISPGSK